MSQTSVVWETPFPWGGLTLNTKSEIRSLSVHLDLVLTMETQVSSVICSAHFQLWQITQLNPHLDVRALTTLVHALLVSRLDYCNVFYVALSLRLTRKLQTVQKVVARLLTGVKIYQHISSTLATLH